MPRYHSKIRVNLAIFICASFFIFPISVKAIEPIAPVTPLQTTTTLTTSPTTEETNLCAIFEKVEANVTADADKKVADDLKKQVQQDASRALIRSTLDSKIIEVRAKWTDSRKDYFAKLDVRAVTEDQKIAVRKFEKAVDDALANRQKEIDKARAVYRNNVDAAITQRRDNAKTALPILKESAKTAATEARNKCSEPLPNLQIITSTLKGQLITVQSTFKSSVQGTELIEKTLEKIAEARLDAIKKIDNDFKTTEEAARLKLRTVLGEGF